MKWTTSSDCNQLEGINAAGVQVRVVVWLTEERRHDEILLTQERSRELGLRPNSMVFVKPMQIKVFEGDWVI